MNMNNKTSFCLVLKIKLSCTKFFLKHPHNFEWFLSRFRNPSAWKSKNTREQSLNLSFFWEKEEEFQKDGRFQLASLDAVMFSDFQRNDLQIRLHMPFFINRKHPDCGYYFDDNTCCNWRYYYANTSFRVGIIISVRKPETPGW